MHTHHARSNPSFAKASEDVTSVRDSLAPEPLTVRVPDKPVSKVKRPHGGVVLLYGWRARTRT